MPNALATPPDAPQDGMQPQGGGNPLQAGPAPQGPPQPGQAPQQPMPAPTHAQTVAALRHFDAIERQLEPLMKNPTLGKASVKSQIIDATTKLVAGRILSPGEAVRQLGTVPEDPAQQKRWVQDHFANAMKGRDAVLAHHQQAFAGSPEEAHEAGGGADSHLDDMAGLMSSHYKPQK